MDVKLETKVNRFAKPLAIGALVVAGVYFSTQSDTVREGVTAVREVIVEQAYNHRPDLTWPHARELYRR